MKEEEGKQEKRKKRRTYASWKAALRRTMNGWRSFCNAHSSPKIMSRPVLCCRRLYLLISFTAYHSLFRMYMPDRTNPKPPSPINALKIKCTLDIFAFIVAIAKADGTSGQQIVVFYSPCWAGTRGG